MIWLEIRCDRMGDGHPECWSIASRNPARMATSPAEVAETSTKLLAEARKAGWVVDKRKRHGGIVCPGCNARP